MIKGLNLTDCGLEVEGSYYVRQACKELWAYLAKEDDSAILSVLGAPGNLTDFILLLYLLTYDLYSWYL